MSLYSPEDYLRLERDGEIHAMSGASRRHNVIAGNAYVHLRNQARGKPCEAYTADVKLHVAAQNSFYYPDAMLVCAEDDEHTHYVTRPCIVVEVISPGSASIDRREKLMAYRKLESPVAYLLVETDRRQVGYYLRDRDGERHSGSLGENEILNLDCAGYPVHLCLDDLYEDLAF